MYELTTWLTEPTADDFLLDGKRAHGYIYAVTNRHTGRTYVGYHTYDASEPWHDYLGSGMLLRDEQRFLEPHLFKNPEEVYFKLLERAPGSTSRVYVKRLLALVSSESEGYEVEEGFIRRLIEKPGATSYNLDLVTSLSLTYETRRDVLAFRLSFQPTQSAKLEAQLVAVRSSFPFLAEDAFLLEFEALALARLIRRERSRLRAWCSRV